MPKSHKPYPAELKARLVELVRAGRNPEEFATKFEPTAQAIRNWVRQADLDAGRRQDGLPKQPTCVAVWPGQKRPDRWRSRCRW